MIVTYLTFVKFFFDSAREGFIDFTMVFFFRGIRASKLTFEAS